MLRTRHGVPQEFAEEGQDSPPLRFGAGADAVATIERKANDLLAQVSS